MTCCIARDRGVGFGRGGRCLEGLDACSRPAEDPPSLEGPMQLSLSAVKIRNDVVAHSFHLSGALTLRYVDRFRRGSARSHRQRLGRDS